MKANKADNLYIRPFLIGATIVTVVILHFAVSQFIFFKEGVKDVSVNELTVEQPAIIKPDDKAEKAETKNMIKSVSPLPQPEPKIEARQSVEKETETVNRKKVPRETRAQRLRRAERILTGV